MTKDVLHAAMVQNLKPVKSPQPEQFRERSILTLLGGMGQTWKKLQAVQAALADILLEITLF